MASNCPGDDRNLAGVEAVVEGHLISVAAREKCVTSGTRNSCKDTCLIV